MEVYLDNSATTRAYECVRDIVGKVMCEDYGNPSSMHKKGVDAEAYVREAKETLAKILKVQEKELCIDRRCTCQSPCRQASDHQFN